MDTWKGKYLDALDEIDRKEQSWSAIETLLRRAVARVAITASGVDELTDGPLHDIRGAVGKVLDTERLEGALTQLSECVITVEGIEPAEPDRSPGSDTQTAPGPGSRPDSPEVEEPAGKLEAVLIDLIDRLSVTPAIAEALASTRSRLRDGFASEGRDEVLQELADGVGRVLESLRETRRSLESLVGHVSEQLGHFQDYVAHAHADLESSVESRAELEAGVSAHVDGLRDEVLGSDDVDSLRRGIQDRLAGISDQILCYRQREDTRLSKSRHENAALTQRIRDLETETVELGSRCEEQESELTLDPLTQVDNRYSYERQIHEEFERWRRYHQPVSFAIWDVDRFKAVNDTFGHQAGDQALTRLAQIVRSNLRESDFLARIGGEEFVVLMPGVDAEQATLVMEKLRRNVELTGFHLKRRRTPITISCGITELRPGDSPASVYERADQALYRAKTGGRNRCVTV